MAALSSLVDMFRTVDPALWEFTAGRANINRGRLEVSSSWVDAVDASTLTTRFSGELWSVASYDARGEALTVEVPVVLSNATGVTELGLFRTSPRTESVLWQFITDPGSTWPRQLQAVRRANGFTSVLATLRLDLQETRFLRIAEDSGVFTWSTSPDGYTWTTAAIATVAWSAAAVRVALGCWHTSPGDTAGVAQFDTLNVDLTARDAVTITGQDGDPYLAVDVQPDVITGAFVVGHSQVGGPDVLAWSNDEPDTWTNVVCDVLTVEYQRGATRQQGVLTTTEAGAGTVVLEDTRSAFDPNTNRDAITKGTPARLRAWGTRPAWPLRPARWNRVPNPRAAVNAAGYVGSAGTGGTVTGGRVATGGPDAGPFFRQRWTKATTNAAGTSSSAYLRADGRLQTSLPIPVAAGETVGAAVYVRSSVAQRLQAAVWWYRADGTALTSVGGASQVVPANTWTRLLVTPPGAPATPAACQGGVFAGAGTGAVPWPVEATLDVAMLQVETGAVGAYFDGDTADAGALSTRVEYQWSGNPYGSASVQLVAGAREDERWDAVLFTAEVDSVAVDYAPGQDAPVVTLDLVDLVGPLSAWESEGVGGTGVGPGQTLLQRVQTVVQTTGNVEVSSASSSSYAATLAPTQLARPWDELVAAQEAELGRLWVDRHNRLVVRSRGSLPGGPVRGTLSDVHGDAPLGVHCCVADATIVRGSEGLANRVLGSRVQTDPNGAVPAVVRRDDAESQRRHGVSTVNRRGQVVLETDAQVEAWAAALILARTRPELRVDSVRPQPATDDLDSALLAWPAVLQTDLGDRWLFHYHPVRGPAILRALGVLGIAVSITPEGWSVTWTTEEAPAPGVANPTGWVTLGLSSAGGPDLLAPYSAPASLS